jgi:hypothetical protein
MPRTNQENAVSKSVNRFHFLNFGEIQPNELKMIMEVWKKKKK